MRDARPPSALATCSLPVPSIGALLAGVVGFCLPRPGHKMRWFVDVSGDGVSARAERYCVDANAWQTALQATQKLRGDRAPLSRLSVELLQEGYRAVDPVGGVRYQVSQAPSDAPLISTPANGVSYSGVGANAQAETTVPIDASVGASLTASSPNSRPAQDHSKSDSAGGRTPKVFLSRTQPPNTEAPITYCEQAVLVATGLDRQEVEAVLRDTWSAVREELRTSPPGQLVQIAVFDHEFLERPSHPPLGTLTWKDWRGDPVLNFPAPVEPEPALTSRLPTQPSPEELTLPPAEPTPPPREFAAPAEALVSLAEPAAPLPRTEAGVAASTAPKHPDPQKRPAVESSPPAIGSSRGSGAASSRPKLVVASRRFEEDLVAELFESMHSLHFARDIFMGADFVLNLLDEVIPSEISLVQVFDIDKRAFVVVRARGPGAERALAYASADTDQQIAEIMRWESARTTPASAENPLNTGRLAFFTRPITELLSGPVQQEGRYLGLLEIANPFGGIPFQRREINALDYVCAQFADFVADRPIVLEADLIIGR